jgi:CheY-like chemotaxis protein
VSRSIVFVEEKAGESRAYVRSLRFRGFSLAATTLEHEVIRMVERDPLPAAIVIARSDAGRVDAWRLARLLRSAPRTRRVPIIALSEATQASAPVLALAAGCNQFIPMPCSPEELWVAIQTACAPAARPTIRPDSRSMRDDRT